MAIILNILKIALTAIGLLALTMIIALRLRRATYALLHNRFPTWSSFISNVVQIVVLLIGLRLTIYIAGINTAVILTIVAIFTAGFSLALDGSVRDLIATTKLLTFGYYKVGDLVTLNGLMGKVIDITAFSTILETGNRDKLIISNKEIVDKIIMNHTAITGRTISVSIPIHGPHNRAQVMSVLLDVAQQCPERLASPEFAPNIFYELMPDHQKYTISIVVPNQSVPNRVITALALEAANHLQEKGIQLS